MIIKGERVSASRAASPLVEHLVRGEDNDAVTVLQGTEADLRSSFDDARAMDRKFALRHFIISPALETSREDAFMVLGLLAKEFGFTPSSAFVVEHIKARATPETAFGGHWHALVPEQDPSANGRTMSSKFSFLRNQKVARIAETKLGHPLVASAHPSAIAAALEADGELEIATILKSEAAKMAARPREAFSSDVHQMGIRLGVDIPAARAAVRAAWETTATKAAFEDALGESRLCICSGAKPGTFIVETSEGVFVGAAHRLARVRRTDIETRMKGTANERKPNPLARKREGVPGPVALGNHSNQRLADTTGSQPVGQDAGRADLGTSGLDLARAARSTDWPGSASPAHRRDRSLRARSGARRLAKSLKQNPERAKRLRDRASALAKPPAERVDLELAALESRLELEIKRRHSLPGPSEDLLAAQARSTKLIEAVERLDEQVKRAEHVVVAVGDKIPLGLRSRLNGQRTAWEARMSKARAQLQVLQNKAELAEQRLSVAQHVATTLAQGERHSHSMRIRMPDYAEGTERIRHRISTVQKARRHLQVQSALAWGGMMMVLAAALALEVTKVTLEEEFGRGPLPSLLGSSDLWGIGHLT